MRGDAMHQRHRRRRQFLYRDEERSLRSAALGRTFALALVKGGLARIGERLRAPLLDGSVVEVEIAPSKLFDPDDARRDGEPSRRDGEP